jgi:hypothetical protein
MASREAEWSHYWWWHWVTGSYGALPHICSDGFGMSELIGNQSTEGLTGGNYGGTNYVVFDPMQMLLDHYGADSVTYQYWCSTCGDALKPVLVNQDSLAFQDAPEYYCFEADCLAVNAFEIGQPIGTVCDILRMWLFSSFWANQTGNPENAECSSCSSG